MEAKARTMEKRGCAPISDVVIDGDSLDTEPPFDWSKLGENRKLLRSYYRMLGVILAAGIGLMVVFYMVGSPRYTAIAVIGPPGPSPTGSMMSSVGGTFASGLASKMLRGGGGGSDSDPYQGYLQILPSTRLLSALIERDHILESVYSNRWNLETMSWKAPSALFPVTSAIKHFFKRPVSDRPTLDNLSQFFDASFDVSKSNKNSPMSLISGGSSYMQVSLVYKDPQEAERLLNVILDEADRLMRDDDRRDVTARIKYLRKELGKQSLSTDERSALTSILSDQEQLLTMIEADRRYAFSMMVPPYASAVPTSPSGPGKMIVLITFVSVAAWIGIVLASTWNARLEGVIRRFRHKTGPGR